MGNLLANSCISNHCVCVCVEGDILAGPHNVKDPFEGLGLVFSTGCRVVQTKSGTEKIHCQQRERSVVGEGLSSPLALKGLFTSGSRAV